MARKPLTLLSSADSLTVLQWSRAMNGAETVIGVCITRSPERLQWSRAMNGAETQIDGATGTISDSLQWSRAMNGAETP